MPAAAPHRVASRPARVECQPVRRIRHSAPDRVRMRAFAARTFPRDALRSRRRAQQNLFKFKWFVRLCFRGSAACLCGSTLAGNRRAQPDVQDLTRRRPARGHHAVRESGPPAPLRRASGLESRGPFRVAGVASVLTCRLIGYTVLAMRPLRKLELSECLRPSGPRRHKSGMTALRRAAISNELCGRTCARTGSCGT